MKTLGALAVSAITLISACGSGASRVICETDGVVCPEPLFCNDEGNCDREDPPGECVDLDDGDLCEAGNGTCVGEDCEAFICGDGVSDANETCDGPAQTASCADEDFGFDFGVPDCDGDCSETSTSTCGRFGAKLVTGGVGTSQLLDIYATKDEVWAVGNATGYHHDGLKWVADAALIGVAISGTGADDLWIVDGGAVRHLADGVVTERPLGARAIEAVSKTLVYAAGADLETDLPMIWQYNFESENWDEVFRAESGLPFLDISSAGGAVVATRNDALTVIDAEGALARDFVVPEISAQSKVWGRSATDFYISANGGVVHFDGLAASIRFPILTRVMAGLGDSTFFFGGGAPNSPGLLREHKLGTPPEDIHRLSGLGFLNPMFASFVLGAHSGERIVAFLTDGSVYELQGASFSYLEFNHGSGSPTALRDLEEGADDLYFSRGPNGSTQVGVITDAYGASPQLTEIAVTGNANNVFGRSPDEIYYSSGAEVIRIQNSTELSVLTIDTGFVSDIASFGPDSALAVGSSGSAHLFDGTDWEDVSTAVVGSMTDAFAASDGFVVGTNMGDLHILRGTTWQVIAPPGVIGINAIDGVSTRNFYAAGRSGSLVHCRENGENLVCEPVGPSTALNFDQLVVFSPTDVLVSASDSSKALHFNGSRWSKVSFPMSRPPTDLVGRGRHLWHGSNEGRALERIERSNSWSALAP